MKKILVIFMALIVMSAIALAAGDNVRGEEGAGEVNQEQNQDPNCWDDPWCVPDTEPIVVLSGDKVRGEEGLGSTIQSCVIWEFGCPYGEYDPF